MRFRQLPLSCECGLVPTRIRQVGLSIEHQLVIHWQCLGCRKAMFVVKDLADCWEESPKPEDFDAISSPLYEQEQQQGDVKFLHSLGVRFPSDGDAA
jgi:hypothetical protein